MAQAIISCIVEAIIKQLLTSADQQIELAYGVPDQLKKLEGALSAIKSVLLDAEERHDKSHEVRDWLGKLKDAVYDADDVLDEYKTDILQRQVLVYGNIIKKVCNFCSISNPVLFRRQLGQKVKEIIKNIDEIAANKEKFHFVERSSNKEVAPKKREPTHSYVPSSDVIGREDDKKNIINLLMSPNDKENVTIIPIVGIGGLGKTTLTQYVYNEEEVGSHFDLRIWISVSEEFSIQKISETIIKVASGKDYSHWDLDLLQTRLRQILSTQKYLLVLDDVWNEDRVKWVRVKELLMKGAKGSKIIVTTRNKKVASMMGTIPSPYNLEGLPDDQCLDLFLKWAFDEGQEQPQKLVAIGKEIVKKCGGLPLAVRTLGCLLYKKMDEHEWLLVKNSEMWELDQGETDILPALRLTYDQMPSSLKQCFAFCSLFPKDYVIDKETLIHLWMAQGFLPSSDEEQQLESIGSRYFDELVSRSFLQDVVEGYDGEVKQCKMHHLVHDLARSVAGTECVIMTSRPKTFTERARHVSNFLSHSSGNSSSGNEASLLEILCKAKKLRTLYSPLLKGQESVMDVLIENLKYLRILHLTESEFEDLPRSIRNLLHLRYLDISKNHCIRRLPNSICKLQNLQKLKLYDCKKLDELPRDMWKVSSLRHLEITSRQKYLPERGLEGLTSLCSLSIHNCNHLLSLVEGMQHLTALRTLRLSDCLKLTSLNFSLNSLISLETLEICNCTNLDLRRKNVKEDSLKGCNSLQSLMIRGLNYLQDRKRRKEEDEEQVGQLQLLLIRELKYGAKPESVDKTKGREEKQEEEDVKDDDEEENKQGLAKLRTLIIAGLPKLIKLPKVFENAATSLEYVYISDCSHLLSLPDWFTSLQKCKIKDCPYLQNKTDCTSTKQVQIN